MAEDAKPPFKSRRITQACDYCHRRSKRCKPSEDPNESRCQNCVDFRQPCTYDRPVKRRGVKTSKDSTGSEKRAADTHVPATHAHNQNESITIQPLLHGPFQQTQNDGQWQAPQIARQATIMDLVEIYFEVIYPIFPFFHRPTFLRKVSRGEYVLDRSFFASTMAACALASGRVRDGAVFSPRWDVTQLQSPSSEVFFAAAEEALPKDLTSVSNDHNVLRACALLAVASIQDGKLKYLHQYLGHFFTLVAIDGLQHETNWPKNMGLVELEERRRVFWSVYTLDVYSSVIWSGVIRCREGQADVAYPTEVDDDFFDDDGFRSYPSTSPSSNPISPGSGRPSPCTSNELPLPENSWLSGWNFTTDLYRILEHANDTFRTKRAKQHHETFLNDIFGDNDTSQCSVYQNVMALYANLPQRFKQMNPISLNMMEDRIGFQAANITATVQLLRMILFTTGGATIDSKCQVASEVVDSFLNIPVAYLRALSSPLLHHLGGIGSLLSSVFEQPLCESEYLQIRTVLLSMAQLLANVDLGAPSPESASERLRTQVSRIDTYMASSRQQQQQQQQQQQNSSTRRSQRQNNHRHHHHQQQQAQQQQQHQSCPPQNSSLNYNAANANPTHPYPNATYNPTSHQFTPAESPFSTPHNHDTCTRSGQTTAIGSPVDPMQFQHQLPPELFNDWPFSFTSDWMGLTGSLGGIGGNATFGSAGNGATGGSAGGQIIDV